MTTLTAAMARFAEEPARQLTEPRAPEARVTRDEWCLMLAATRTQSHLSCVRTSAAKLDRVIADVREILKQRGYTGCTWIVGQSCEPPELRDLLLARGFVRATEPPWEPELEAMALARPPVPPRAGVEARLVRDYDEYRQALDIAIRAFELPPDSAAGWLATAPELWKQQDGVDRMTLIATIDGKPVGFAWAGAGRDGLLLCGSGVLPEARGRGAYHALVDARWKIAVRLGKPLLVIHAGAMSRPILERCNFERVCRLDVLLDPEVRSARP
jgi:hypothetical protein